MAKEKIIMSEWKAVNKITGEEMEIDLLQIKDGGSWRKIYAKEFCSMLGIIGKGQIKAFSYMLSIADTKNKIEGTQSELAKKSGVSLKTINTLISNMKEKGYMKEIRSGMYMLYPKTTHYGNVGNKISMLKVWDNLENDL